MMSHVAPSVRATMANDRKAAAQACRMDRQTLRDWVHRYNDGGTAGLSNRHAAGRTALKRPCPLAGRVDGLGGRRFRPSAFRTR
ncbi:helix-turn-helix domain-containing protein [Paracoccus benzoatiresistens]|uniref:helix-turn-helix domain-containing protein n=1 Tax=Paracoccus benzoatiresistens TaxID=2997341 RepID=UPI003530216F